MKLKQEDRYLFREFFDTNKIWIQKNSLNVEKNLTILKEKIIEYMNDKNQIDNLSFMLFTLTIDQEIIESKKRILEMKYRGCTNDLYRKLNYIPICPQLTDNEEILKWINQSHIVHEVSRADMIGLEKSLQKKLEQNRSERLSSWDSAKNIIVK